MASDGPRNDRDNDRRGRRDWLVFLIVLLLGFACILATTEAAVRPARTWQASANMLSELYPELTRDAGRVEIEPLRPEVLTPPPWDQILPTAGTPSVVPGAVVGPPAADATATPRDVASVPTSAPTGPTPTSTPALPPMDTPTPSPVSTPTSPPTPTFAPIPTNTPTPPPTNTPPPPPPPTKKPTGRPTNTPTPTPTHTPTPTPTHTPTPTPTHTSTPTNTPTSTNTPTPTHTPTPTDTPPPPAPVVQAVTPNTRVNDATVAVNISGLNFQPGCSARLGTVPLTVTSCLPTAVSAIVPADIVAGYYDATVTNPDTQFGTLANGYTATNPIPVVTDITPNLSAASTTNLPVTISGDDFRNTGAPGGLRAALGSTSLANVAYIGPTTLSAEVPFSSPGLGLGIYDLTVTNPGPTDPSDSLADAFTVYAYATTCDPTPLCTDAVGEPDASWSDLSVSEVITIDFGAGNGITDGPGYDMVFYERPNAPGIMLDFIRIEIGDGSNWYTVFEWDGDPPPGDVGNTNIASYANDTGGEEDNESIQSDDLYPGGLSPYNTGVAIDIGALGLSGPFRWVRVSNPAPSSGPAEVDAIVRLH